MPLYQRVRGTNLAVNVASVKKLGDIFLNDYNIGTWQREDNFLQHVVLDDKEVRFARLCSRTYESNCDAKPWFKHFYRSIEERSGLQLWTDEWKLIKLEGPAFGEVNGKE